MLFVGLGSVSLTSYQPPPIDMNHPDTRSFIQKMSYSVVQSMGDATGAFIGAVVNHEKLIDEAMVQFETLYPNQKDFISTIEKKETVKCPRRDLSRYYCFAYNPQSKSLDMGNLGQAFNLRRDITDQINSLQSCYAYDDVLNMCLY